MRISTDHRTITQPVPLSAYRQAANRFIELADKANIYDSVIVCGSLIKSDVVTGWSDLDLVCIASDSADKGDTIAVTAHIYQTITAAYHIGLGVDLTWRGEFDRSSRIGGRPLAMTYEVAQYGEFHFNDAPLSSAEPISQMRPALKRERAPLALAEIHNWRRASFQSSALSSELRAAMAVKTLLKLLKILVAPYNGTRFTHSEDLSVLKECVPLTMHQAFEAAIEVRANWMVAGRAEETAIRVCELLANLDVLGFLDVIET
jgi:hypothetical protein